MFVSVFVRKWGLRFSSCHSLSVAFIVFLFLIDLSHYRSWGPSTLRNVDDQYVRKRQILEGPFDCLFVCLFFKIAESWKFLLLHKVNSVQFSSVAQSCLTLCNPMDCSTPGLHPSPTPRVYPNSCPLSQWCHLTISSSVVPFYSCPQSFPALGSFKMSQLFTSDGQIIGVSASTSVLPMNIQDQSPLGWTGWISLQSKGLSRVFSNTTGAVPK